MVTFAVIGRNEASLLANALRDVRQAARRGDRVIYVDGSSTDGSARVARDHGVDVIDAPVGKGRAMNVALDASDTPYVCFFDADLIWSENNIPSVLRDALDEDPPDLLVGAKYEPARNGLRVARTLYATLVGALFPEALEPPEKEPLSGSRVVRRAAMAGPLPPDYGAETHMNISFVMEGRRVATIPVGEYAGPVRGYTNIVAISAGLARATLDAAETYGRLARSMRARWNAWAAPIIDLGYEAERTPDRPEPIHARAVELAKRPLPPTHELGASNGERLHPARGLAGPV
jgi:hypothetical protein